jgi:hypothetical protein
MGIHIIVRPTRREREERLAESRAKSGDPNIVGVVRRTEEAYEIQRQRAKEGYAFDKPYAVDGAAPESIQAERELVQRAGIDPDTYRPQED